MDDNGNSEGNFTVLALDDRCNVIISFTKTNYTINCSYCMKTVGKFYLGPGALPVSAGRHTAAMISLVVVARQRLRCNR